MTYAITRWLPGGETKIAHRDNIREVGQHVAHVLHYNANVSRKEATKLGMQFERDMRIESHGYVFVAVKEQKR